MDSLYRPGEFYLGKLFDTNEGKLTDTPVFYDADDLTTHAVVVGMTGSGKTGLCIGMLEEAALNNLPALMIDPKGDLTNLLLHFPNLLPEDFRPWVNPDLARRTDDNIETIAQQEADKWRKGLEGWGIGKERIEALKMAAQFAIYTPGSDSGLPVSILASLKAPEIPWEDNRELLREKISATVTALLGLVGINNIDPVRSREHILLSNIFENAWQKGTDLTLSELILQTQTPPFQKLGVFDVNTFYPERERFDLAMSLNNILAAPSFQAWIEGQPLDIASLLYTPEGKPRHSVFYIAHLQDSERMFFVTLLFSAIEAWMRSQPGSPSLRSLVYFDEIFGYLPPVSNPPSKPVMMRMLKQARAFGIGLVLATQNPADVDYKGLSNTGTWFVGKLQTDQDKQRLLDGLEGAMAGSFNRKEFDQLISGLGKRVFLLHNVHEKAPKLFGTRWVMNYLAGPMTRTQIPALNRLAGSGKKYSIDNILENHTSNIKTETRETIPVERIEISSAALASFSSTKPAASGIEEYYIANDLTFSRAFKEAGYAIPPQAKNLGIVYRPVLFAQAIIQYQNRKYNLDHEQKPTALVEAPDRRGMVRWEDHLIEPLDNRSIESLADPEGRYALLDAPLSEAKQMSSLKRDFQDWLYHTSRVNVRANEILKIYTGPEVSEEEFQGLCAKSAKRLRDAEVKKVEASFAKRIDAVEIKIKREERELAGDETDLEQRKIEEWGTHAENILSLFGGRKRRVTTSLSKRRMTAQAKADVEESKDALEEFGKQIKELESEKTDALQEIIARYQAVVLETSEITIEPYKKDILVEKFGIAWMPYYLAQVGEDQLELPGFASGS